MQVSYFFARGGANRITGNSLRGWLLLATLLTNIAVATETNAATTSAIAAEDPQALVRQATDRVLQIAIDARAYADEDAERYYQQIETVLNDVVDFEYFTRGVMANYASARQYQSLKTDAEREAFKARITRFADNLRRVLVVTYADALLAFEGRRIELAPTRKGGSVNNQSLTQHIVDGSGKSYVVQYSLRKTKTGEWRIYNVIVEGVNLGQVYRTQFAEAVEKQRGNIDYVVDHWADVVAAEKASKKAASAGAAS